MILALAVLASALMFLANARSLPSPVAKARPAPGAMS